MDEEVSICFPAILSVSSFIEKAGKEKDQYDINNSNMAYPNMVLPTIDHVHSETSFDTTPKIPTPKSIRKTSSFNSKSEAITSIPLQRY